MIEFSIVNTVNTRNPRADFEAHLMGCSAITKLAGPGLTPAARKRFERDQVESIEAESANDALDVVLSDEWDDGTMADAGFTGYVHNCAR